MRILGIDPGTVRFGYGVIDVDPYGSKCIAYGCLEARRTSDIHSRLFTIYKGLEKVILDWSPEHLAIEEPFVSLDRGAKSGVAVGQAQAIALLLAASAEMDVYRYMPSQVKSAIADYGASNKTQVQRMVQVILGMPQEPISEDASDALAVALCHVGHLKIQRLVEKL